MKPIVTIIAQGAMGAGVARNLVARGVEVRTSLEGRSPASAARANAAGMRAVGEAEIAGSDFILSILPPGDALALAERFKGALTRAAKKPVYVDCNAVNPKTVRAIADVIAATGCPFVDASIIGGPPAPGGRGPAFYASGPEVRRFETLTEHGLDVRVLSDAIGDASAIKMAYAGITKGLSALGAAMFLAATRAGVADALRRELASSLPGLQSWFTRYLPSMPPKAYRWIGEMEEIAGFVADEKGAEQIFLGAAELFRSMAVDVASTGAKTGALGEFVAPWQAAAAD